MKKCCSFHLWVVTELAVGCHVQQSFPDNMLHIDMYALTVENCVQGAAERAGSGKSLGREEMPGHPR